MFETICYGGLGNRVNEILNGKLAFGGGSISWNVNEHCPFTFEQIFKGAMGFDEIKNLQTGDIGFIEEYWANLYPEGGYCSYWYAGNTTMGHITTHDELVHTYKEILSNLIGEKNEDEYTLGIHYRGMGTACGDMSQFLDCILDTWDGGRAFVLADCNRDVIGEFLHSNKIPFDFGLSPEMNGDKDRGDYNIMRKFIQDFKTLNSCKVIVTSSSISTMTDPARAFGSKIIHVGPLRTDPACWFVVNNPQSFIQK